MESGDRVEGVILQAFVFGDDARVRRVVGVMYKIFKEEGTFTTSQYNYCMRYGPGSNVEFVLLIQMCYYKSLRRKMNAITRQESNADSSTILTFTHCLLSMFDRPFNISFVVSIL